MIKILGIEKKYEGQYSGLQPLYAVRVFKKNGEIFYEAFTSKKQALRNIGKIQRDIVLIQCVDENRELLIQNNFSNFEPYMR